MVIKAVVPVRNNSIRCKNKNFRDFAGKSIFQIKIEQLKRIELLDGIMVISDNCQALEFAEKMGCEVFEEPPVPPENVLPNELFGLIAEATNADDIMIAHATSPLLCDKSIEQAIVFYYQHKSEYDSVNSAQELKKFLFMDNKPINYDPLKHPRSQDLKPVMARIPAFSIMSRELMLRRKANVGYNPFLFKISDIEAVDLDTEAEFEYAEFLYKKYYLLSMQEKL